MSSSTLYFDYSDLSTTALVSSVYYGTFKITPAKITELKSTLVSNSKTIYTANENTNNPSILERKLESLINVEYKNTNNQTFTGGGRYLLDAIEEKILEISDPILYNTVMQKYYEITNYILATFKTSTTQDITLLTNEQSVRENIKNLLETEPGDLIYKRLSVGTSLRRFLFQPIDAVTSYELIQEVKTNILKYYGNVIDGSTLKVSVLPKPDDNAYEIYINAIMTERYQEVNLTINLSI